MWSRVTRGEAELGLGDPREAPPMTAWASLCLSPCNCLSVLCLPLSCLSLGNWLCCLPLYDCDLSLPLSSVSISLCLFLSLCLSAAISVAVCLTFHLSGPSLSLWFSASLLLPIATEHPHPRMGLRGAPQKRKGLSPTFVGEGLLTLPGTIAHSRGTQERAGFS